MGRESKELAKGLEEDSIVRRLQVKMRAMNIQKWAFIVLIVVLIMIVTLFKSQLSQQEIRNKSNSISLYNISRNVEKINRRNNCIAMVTKVALHCNPKISEKRLAKVAALLYDEGELKYGIKVEEWIVMITRESWWNGLAESDAGAVGLMQLMPATAKFLCASLGITYMGRTTRENMVDNVRLGMYYMYILKKIYKLPKYYITAYNWGETAIGKYSKDSKDLRDKHRTYFYTDIASTKSKVEGWIGHKITLGD